ncbi:MAG TPA: ABC transporter ATP-binding protein [Woeseiaceae bacterium]|jgi:ABC-2 type transport system ATP-binding protein|nr:ABC transporter ATP-binding protein [Woeseiaceae bacterium]
MKALSIKNLTKTYANGNEALKGIDLDVAQGDFFALLGPNGAGKTTAIGIISSLVNKSGGDVEIFGHDIDTELNAAKACLGIVPQEINLNLWETVGNTMIYQAGYYGLSGKLAKERVEKYLRELRLWDRRDDNARSLSGGMKRRLMIARALVHEPKLLILDEPTAGVDIEIRRSMWDFLREINAAGTTIILTTHYLEEAEALCRNIAIIDEGTIIEDSSMKEILRRLHREVFVLSVEVELCDSPELPGFVTRLREDGELEVEKGPETDMNDLFVALQDKGIRVASLRNKANRLEEMFMHLVESKGDGT